jgi:hypothetical protein
MDRAILMSMGIGWSISSVLGLVILNAQAYMVQPILYVKE